MKVCPYSKRITNIFVCIGLWHWKGQWEDAECPGYHYLFPSWPEDGTPVIVICRDSLASFRWGFSWLGLRICTQVPHRLAKYIIHKWFTQSLILNDDAFFHSGMKSEKVWAQKGKADWVGAVKQNYFNLSLHHLTWKFHTPKLNRTFRELSKAEDQLSLCRELCEDLAGDLKKEDLKVGCSVLIARLTYWGKWSKSYGVNHWENPS